ncbi:MAG: penicillin-binding transpeptidase domain-containing protein, partial [Verrucomicrobiota bacterium]
EELSKRFRKEYADYVEAYRRHHGRRPAPEETAAIERHVRFRVVSDLVTRLGNSLQVPVSLNEKRFHRHFAELRALPMNVLEDLAPPQVALYVERGAGVPAVDLETLALRTYPHGTIASHLLGHLKKELLAEDAELDCDLPALEFRGELGIESAFDEELRGKPGLKSILVNNLNYRHSESVWTQPEPGRNVVLAIDFPIQKATEQALRTAGAQVRGAAVVMDCRTGDLYALASSPSFDPNQFVSRITPEEWAKLNDEKLKPMFNRAVYGAYPPGSIFKTIVGIACLENNVMDPAEVIFNRGFYAVGRRPIDDQAEPGEYDFRRAFKRSSNTYFIHFGLKAGLDPIVEWGHRFRLGEKTGLVTRQESSGYFPAPGQREKKDGTLWFDGDTANLCIGQGDITVTPIQMAVMTAALANGGKILVPRLVLRTEPADHLETGSRREFPVQVRGDVRMSPRTFQILKTSMLADVEDTDGTGHPARVPGMNICGKTGTAQVTQGRRVIDHITWFVSFAPFENPRYAVVVMVESGGSGGTTCAPIAQRIYQAIQKREQMAPAAKPATVARR